MTTKTRYIIISFVLVIAVGLFGIFGWQYFNRNQVNYLIPGVPYDGVYSHFLEFDSPVVTSVADILGYWGDEVDLPFLSSALEGYDITTSQLENFFQAKGYKTYLYVSGQAGNEINEIKKFVNPKMKIPVIVYQKRSIDPDRISNGLRVVIGVFDNEKKIITHDHDFGNNYEISYTDFEAMFRPNARTILAVWPSTDLAKKIKGPDYSRVYQARWPEMEKIGQFLMKGADFVTFYFQKNYEKASQLIPELIDDPALSYLPPAHQVQLYSLLVRNSLGRLDVSQNNSNNPVILDEAIDFINNQILPLNNNLSQPYKNWTEQIEFFKNHNYSEDKFVTPYYLLGRVYLLKGDNEMARKNFEEALKIDPSHKASQTALQQLK